jgi:hypothetical protein
VKLKQLALFPSIFALTAVLSMHPGVFAKSNVEAAQLDYVALDASVDCNRIFFKGSQHFKGVLFVVPRVVPGTGVEGGRTYNLRPIVGKPGFYNLMINIYFPANDELAKSNASNFKRDRLACNWDLVKNAVNKDIADPTQRVQTISRIPLTSLEVRIAGIQDVALLGRSLVSSEEADILDYYGKSMTAIFQINESERIAFQSQLVSNEGIPASVKFRFQARNRNGSVHAKVDTATLTRNLSAAVKGKRLVTSAELSVMLKDSLTANSIQITSEGGSSPELIEKISSQIIAKIFQEISLKAKDAETRKATAGSGTVSAAVVMDIVKTKVSGEIDFNLISAPETATAQSELRLHTESLNDPNITEIKVTSSYLDPSAGMDPLKAGQTFSISAAYWYMDRITYPEVRRYLSLSDMLEMKLNGLFDDLNNSNMKVENVSVNGNVFAEGTWAAYPGFSFISSPKKYRWVQIIREANRARVISELIPPTLKALTSLPISLTFSELNDRRLFSMADLLEPNPFWTATFDKFSGQLFITAKQDLGHIRFREQMFGKENMELGPPVVLDEVLEQKLHFFGEKEYVERHVRKADQKPMIKQKTIVLYVSRPRVLSTAEKKRLYFSKNLPGEPGDVLP